MKINIKKTLKLATLLATSLLIATASAQIYNYMYIQGTINVGGTQEIVWIKGGVEQSGDTVSVEFDVVPNNTKTFNGTLYLKNKNDSKNYTISAIEVIDTVGSNFEICKAYIYENFTQSSQWTLVGILNLASTSNPITNKTLNAGGYYKFDFEIRATSSTGDNTFTIKVTYE